MIIGKNRDQVIHNIEEAAKDRDFYRKVEVDDPTLTLEEKDSLLSSSWKAKQTFGVKVCNLAARAMAWAATRWINRYSKIEGLENIKGIKTGAVITSNHFSPLDNTVIRLAVFKAFHERFYIVSQETNLAMKGIIGFLMNYTDTVPISNTVRYMNDTFEPTMKKMLNEGDKILIYPEQEMWFHYRKPRPPKRGAYFYAAENNVPVISCFVEIRERNRKEKDENFYRTKYILHIMPTIYPDPEKTPSENSRIMMQIDYDQKKEAYEKAYGKPLTYDFEPGDIAGWIGAENVQENRKV